MSAHTAVDRGRPDAAIIESGVLRKNVAQPPRDASGAPDGFSTGADAVEGIQSLDTPVRDPDSRVDREDSREERR
ncbi:hypothetical protein [Cellulomonas sp. NS3]|uniref:hypothetical protein n=1 Tax=Cellulomonas sp. NS3 TaxID=2973977 RepID=UPI00216302F8|nr:hypothetical protein [Cellulomonas sp. NS3]